MSETRAEWRNYCFRQLPADSVCFRGHMRCVWVGDRRWGDFYEKERNSLNVRNYGGVGELLLPSSSFSFRVHPRCVWVEDGTWGIIRKRQKNALNGRN